MRALIAPWGRKTTYVRTLYLLIGLPVAIAYFAGLVGGIAAGLALVIVWVGIPILFAVGVGWRAVARFERRLNVDFLDAVIETTPSPLPDGDSVWGRVKALAKDPFTWTSLAWLMVRFPLAIFSFVAVVGVVAFAAGGLTAPLTIVFTDNIQIGPGVFLDRPIETWPLVLAGIVALMAAPHIVNAMAWVHARGAEKLLNPTAGQRAEQLEQRTAVLEERTRLAQELHDAVGHTITAATLQAGAAGHVFEDDPEFARRALDDIETSGRRALGELDRILGILRDNESAELEPAPSVDEIDSLIDAARSAGLTIEWTLTGSSDVLPDELGRAVYRIVQEGLTNVMKHAGIVRTNVTVAVEEDAVLVIVDNAAPSESTANHEGVPGSQSGLIGIEERVAAYKGTLNHHPTADGGYHLEVVLPLTKQQS